MVEKEGGIIKKDHDESMKLAMDIYSEFGLPLGMLPLKDVIEAGFVRSTGYVWIVQKENVEHSFKVGSYDTEITDYIEKRRMNKLREWPTRSSKVILEGLYRAHQDFPYRGLCGWVMIAHLLREG